MDHGTDLGDRVTTVDPGEEQLRLARRVILAIGETLAGAGGHPVPAWCDPDLVAGGLDTVAAIAAGLAGQLRHDGDLR